MFLEDVKSHTLVWQYVVNVFMRITHPLGGSWWSDAVHGAGHLCSVREGAKLVAELCNVDDSMTRCLRVAAEVHDLGRVGEYNTFLPTPPIADAIKKSMADGRVDHALLSANLFRLMPIADLDGKEIEAIYFAVKNHSKGLNGLGIVKTTTFEEELLGLLTICDHCLGATTKEGFERAALHVVRREFRPVFSSTYSFKEIRDVIANDRIVPPEKVRVYKADSLASHLAINFHESFRAMTAVEHLLSPACVSYLFHHLAKYFFLTLPLLEMGYLDRETTT